MADFYTFNVFEMNQDGTIKRDMVVNLDTILTVTPITDIEGKPINANQMNILLIDGTTIKAFHYDKFVEDMGRKYNG